MTNSHIPNLPVFVQTVDGFRHETARYNPCQRGWYQDGRRLRPVKTSKAFIWPKDGKNGSSWGRMKDILRNTGPDIYIGFGARSTDCVSSRPPRSQWAGYPHLDESGMSCGFNSQKFAPWTKSRMLGGRQCGLSYDFRTRKHAEPNRSTWTDAIWQQEPYRNRKSNHYPEAVRMVNGVWFQDTQYLPQVLGGHVDNEFGVGLPFHHLV
ncbi:hypothetical protein COCCADRAFT_86532 [Bipolaris zeicola 26-R-13]|uniref:Uncharacterized protein n=1 Tax=Cochliobolus carbonum (strain 26-R-13) TaxID=930089 RepID=W6YH12_COCC2|nr:uncharacterized protein COCCADRAFT_86532 [Bipolaris zeicola 26-R-13]EUC36998.1 hypothetical protein COCCADRAFT_86532 [Bipolaris zeicola 26-R-13]